MALDSSWRKFKNKITDTINGNKWDRSCVNPALLGSAEESAGEGSSATESFDTTNFQKQLDERNARLEMIKPAPELDIAGERAMNKPVPFAGEKPAEEPGLDFLKKSDEKAEEPTLDFLSKPVEHAPVEEKPVERALVEEKPLPKAPEESGFAPKAPVVPGIPRYVPTPSAVAAVSGGAHSESSESADLKKEDASVKTEESLPDKGTPVKTEESTPIKTEENTPVGFVSKCYYVKLIHEDTYPKEGSVRIMRSCDHEYVWTDSIAETEIPTCTVCGKCGKPVEYTEVRMP